MALYTIIFEYRDGTYIEQVQAANELIAFNVWANKINPNTIQYFGEKLKETLIEDTHNQDYAPIHLTGLKNVWCAGWSLSGQINIVKTENG